MGVLFDYFAAASNDEAAAVIDRAGGPAGDGEPRYATVAAQGFEPFVKMGTLTSLLTGRAYDEIADEYGELVAIRDEGERLVARMPDAVTNALADASDERLAEVAGPWSRTEEFAWEHVGPADLTPVLHRLGALARDARANGQRLYCWVCV